MKLQEIVWPAYRLSEKPPSFTEGITYFHTEYMDDSRDTTVNMRVVDDKSIDQPSLGRRRLVLSQDDKVKLYTINAAIYFVADLIKLAKSTTWFIDSSGKVFQYKKVTRAKLTTRKIKQILPAESLGCVLEIEGIATRFKCLIRPKDYQQYAVLLQNGMGYILYGLSETLRPNSWRMV